MKIREAVQQALTAAQVNQVDAVQVIKPDGSYFLMVSDTHRRMDDDLGDNEVRLLNSWSAEDSGTNPNW